MTINQDFFIRLLLVVTYTFIAGVVFGNFYPLMPEELGPLWMTLSGVALVGGAGMFLVRSMGWRHTFFVFGVIGLVAFLAGWGRHSQGLDHLYPNNVTEHLSSNFDDTRIIEGTVTAAPQVYEDQVRLQMKPDKIGYGGDTYPIEHGEIWLQVAESHLEFNDYDLDYSELAKNDIYSDRLRIKAPLSEPMPRTVPHGFDFQQFLHNQGIYGAVWFSQEIERLEENEGNPFVAAALDLQMEMLKSFKLTMPYPYSAFLGGATLGLREGLAYTRTPFETTSRPDHIKEEEYKFLQKRLDREFGGAGTGHVLAVSGLHVGVLAGTFWALFAGLKLPKKIYSPIIIIILCIFLVITGARPSTQRATIMTGMILLVFAYSDRGLGNSALVGLSAAAVAILFFQPGLIFEASFLLSFVAVLCLVLITPPVDELLQKLRGLSFILFWCVALVTTLAFVFAWNFMLQTWVIIPYVAACAGGFWGAMKLDEQYRFLGGIGFLDMPSSIRNFIAAQFAIQLGMMWPLSAYYFLEYPFAGIYANLIAIPLVGIVVPLGLFSGLVGMFPVVGPWIALFLNAGNFLAVYLFMYISHIALYMFPYPAVKEFTVWHLVIFYSAVAIFVAWRPLMDLFNQVWEDQVQTFHWPSHQVFYSMAAALAVVGFGSFWFMDTAPQDVKITVMDVGYGSAIGIQAPDGTNALLNAGSRQWDWHNEKGLADRTDDGRMTVSDFFLRQQIKELDLFALQSIEPHRVGGSGYIARHFVLNDVVGPLSEDYLGTNPSLDDYAEATGDSYMQENKSSQWFRLDYFHNWKRMWNFMQQQSHDYRRPRAGDVVLSRTLNLNGQQTEMRLIALNPPKDSPYDFRVPENESLVFLLEVGDRRVLFPGDIRTDAQDWLVENAGDKIDADVLIVPSNGAREDSYRSKFYQAVDPNQIVMSTSTNIAIRGPQGKDMEKQIKANWKKMTQEYEEDRLFRTDQDYSVIIRTNGEDLGVWGFAGDQDVAASGSEEGSAYETRY